MEIIYNLKDKKFNSLVKLRNTDMIIVCDQYDNIISSYLVVSYRGTDQGDLLRGTKGFCSLLNLKSGAPSSTKYLNRETSYEEIEERLSLNYSCYFKIIKKEDYNLEIKEV